MKLYDKIINETLDALKDASSGKVRSYPYNATESWKDLGHSEFIMQRDAALEIGGGGCPSVNYTLVTTSGFITEDEIVVCGDDIGEIRGDSAFARIVILETEGLGEDSDQEKAFQAIRNLEFVRYHVFPEGYMVRVSAQSNQEQIRLSKEALKKGISFAKVGKLYIKKYKELPEVKKVRVIFITQKALVEKLLPNADKVDGITKTLTHILDGLPTDCGHCSMKPVCDEVDGMRELHLGKKK
ncbi:MAG: carbon monoxide dehydrogenase [Butyrivibrio sp.]|nr:carbon monoxide dehydrogenase [Butyrivibrio sp.]